MAALDGKTAIVTGASSGIGESTAHALAEAGARVAVGARRVESLPDREGFYAFDLDVTDRESSERFVERAVADLGGIDILVNNAGLGLGRDPFWESTDEDEATVDDGLFITYLGPFGYYENTLANRHDRSRHAGWRLWSDAKRQDLEHRPDRFDRGNVAFIDGHVDLVTRQYTWDIKHLYPN